MRSFDSNSGIGGHLSGFAPPLVLRLNFRRNLSEEPGGLGAFDFSKLLPPAAAEGWSGPLATVPGSAGRCACRAGLAAVVKALRSLTWGLGPLGGGSAPT